MTILLGDLFLKNAQHDNTFYKVSYPATKAQFNRGKLGLP